MCIHVQECTGTHLLCCVSSGQRTCWSGFLLRTMWVLRFKSPGLTASACTSLWPQTFSSRASPCISLQPDLTQVLLPLCLSVLSVRMFSLSEPVTNNCWFYNIYLRFF